MARLGNLASTAVLTVLLGMTAACAEHGGGADPAAPNPGSADDARQAHAELGVHFEPVGDGFLARTGTYSLSLDPASATLALGGDVPQTVKLGFVGSNPYPVLEPADPLPGISNYIAGSDPSQWRTSVPHYGKVRYRSVYPGVDVVFYGKGGQVEYDVVVAPGADPAVVRLTVEAASRPRLDEGGNLVVPTPAGDVVQQAPRLYQEVGGERRPVSGRYELLDHGEVGFSIGAYDRRLPLVIDPVLVYGTYLGGSDHDDATHVDVDGAGNAYVTGSTASVDFPTLNPIQPRRGTQDVFVTKLSPTGTLVHSTTWAARPPS